jgi:type IV pilus assembly protein PilC
MKRMALITLQWSMLYKSGVPMVRCFLVAAEQCRNRVAKHTFIRVADALEAGDTLEEALRSESGRLPPIFVEAMSCAEASGRFDDALDHVCQYFEEWLETRDAITRQVAYPAAVLVAIVFGIPLGIGLLRMSFDGSTDTDMGRFVFHWAIQTAGSVATMFVFVWLLVRTGVWQWIWGTVAVFVWPIGGIIRSYAHARFFRMLGILLGGGMAPRDAVPRAASLTTNSILAADIRRALPLLKKSATLEEALARAQLLPRVARETLAMSEQTGKGPELFEKTAKWLHDEASHRLRTLIWTIEGFLIIAIGLSIVL